MFGRLFYKKLYFIKIYSTFFLIIVTEQKRILRLSRRELYLEDYSDVITQTISLWICVIPKGWQSIANSTKNNATLSKYDSIILYSKS